MFETISAIFYRILFFLLRVKIFVLVGVQNIKVIFQPEGCEKVQYDRRSSISSGSYLVVKILLYRTRTRDRFRLSVRQPCIILIVISTLFQQVYSNSHPLLSHPRSAILSTFLFPQAPSHPTNIFHCHTTSEKTLAR